jgi:hypothetical protein
VGRGPVKDLSLGLLVLVVLLQASDMCAKPCFVLAAYVSEITLLLVPFFFNVLLVSPL